MGPGIGLTVGSVVHTITTVGKKEIIIMVITMTEL